MLQEPLHVVYRRVKRMVRLGLVRESGLIERAGRPIRLYRTTSQRFFIPFTLKSFEEVMTDMNRARQRQFMAGLSNSWLEFSDTNRGWGATFYRASNGRLYGQAPTALDSTVSPPPHTPTVMRWKELRLSTDDARAMADQIFAVVQQFEARSRPEHRTYLLGVNLVAVAPD